MSPDILLSVREKLTNSKLLDKKQLDKFLDILKLYRTNKIIYPGVIIREVNIPVEKVYEVLGELVAIGILEMNYELYCHNCKHFKGKIYRSLASIPKELTCDECDKDLNKLDDTILIFRVIADGK